MILFIRNSKYFCEYFQFKNRNVPLVVLLKIRIFEHSSLIEKNRLKFCFSPGFRKKSRSSCLRHAGQRPDPPARAPCARWSVAAACDNQACRSRERQQAGERPGSRANSRTCVDGHDGKTVFSWRVRGRQRSRGKARAPSGPVLVLILVPSLVLALDQQVMRGARVNDRRAHALAPRNAVEPADGRLQGRVPPLAGMLDQAQEGLGMQHGLGDRR